MKPHGTYFPSLTYCNSLRSFEWRLVLTWEVGTAVLGDDEGNDGRMLHDVLVDDTQVDDGQNNGGGVNDVV